MNDHHCIPAAAPAAAGARVQYLYVSIEQNADNISCVLFILVPGRVLYMYIYIYIHTYTYVCIHIYIYIHILT